MNDEWSFGFLKSENCRLNPFTRVAESTLSPSLSSGP